MHPELRRRLRALASIILVIVAIMAVLAVRCHRHRGETGYDCAHDPSACEPGLSCRGLGNFGGVKERSVCVPPDFKSMPEKDVYDDLEVYASWGALGFLGVVLALTLTLGIRNLFRRAEDRTSP